MNHEYCNNSLAPSYPSKRPTTRYHSLINCDQLGNPWCSPDGAGCFGIAILNTPPAWSNHTHNLVKPAFTFAPNYAMQADTVIARVSLRYCKGPISCSLCLLSRQFDFWSKNSLTFRRPEEVPIRLDSSSRGPFGFHCPRPAVSVAHVVVIQVC